MSSEGLRTEVSTDILLYENKEMGGSGVVFVENIPEFCQKERISVSILYSVCQVLQDRFSKLITSTDRTWQLILNSISKTKEEISTLEELIRRKDAEEETKSFFSVAPLLFLESTIPPQDKCYVKLSSTVIVEMTLDEALKFAKEKHERLVKNEDIFHKQYNYYRDQTTILTLNMNRCLAFLQDQVDVFLCFLLFRLQRKRRKESELSSY
ncbi:hypothetical protein JH06_5014 [Blastocystis sp. subtype 4]|uniref:hypothetical protein n=1 Tax=Blastocystis sp. subtype 4 TaxID=944170 RepID=UPI0007112C61|nr:hypothetical protein JH06_5014 [Blastocystis sp. subtype 4]KNB41594.1 hypothetical protein JH06_5014 [Blastocystis sp. subtype 4]|eukprot:XP_014525037.1 hypothetical protein JH06_5014 [Blastocystis sp. subtype 4]